MRFIIDGEDDDKIQELSKKVKITYADGPKLKHRTDCDGLDALNAAWSSRLDFYLRGCCLFDDKGKQIKTDSQVCINNVRMLLDKDDVVIVKGNCEVLLLYTARKGNCEVLLVYTARMLN